jgi:protein-S-isoprenylcysteine O-methyltransferase Ste14
MDSLQKGKEIRDFTLVLAQIALIATIIFVFLFKLDSIPDILSILLIIAGLILIALGFIHLGKNLKALPEPKAGGVLVVNGIYRIMRNPIYSGIMLAALGSCFYKPSFWPFFLWALLVVILMVKVMIEESYLSKRFKNYGKYARKTKRFLPYLF